MEEIYKIFQENNGSFYFSHEFDLTNSIERQHSNIYDSSLPLWKRADSRFFWNMPLINELFDLKPDCHNSFIIPVIQGFVQSETVNIEPRFINNTSNGEMGQIEFNSLKLCLISRRSRFRLGIFF